MNYFVYYTLSAWSYHISRASFIVAKKWWGTSVFDQIIALFSSSSFKSLPREEQLKIYDQINQFKKEEKNFLFVEKWLATCFEQLESMQLEKVPRLTLKKNKRKE